MSVLSIYVISKDYNAQSKANLHYKSMGQTGWDLDRLVDESTLDVNEVPSEIYPEWFKFKDKTNPTEKEKLIDLYKNEI